MKKNRRCSLETATSESSFIFDYLLYKQVDRMAMGSPLGPTLVNAFICHYEKECLDNCPIHFKPMIYKRYVDHIFVLFSFKEHLQLFVDYMNKKHLFIENQLSLVYLRTMKVIWMKHIRSH